MLKPAAGPTFFAVIAVLLLALSYLMWPAAFFGTPFSEMTSGMLLRTVVSLVLATIGVEFLAALAILLLSDNQ